MFRCLYFSPIWFWNVGDVFLNLCRGLLKLSATILIDLMMKCEMRMTFLSRRKKRGYKFHLTQDSFSFLVFLSSFYRVVVAHHGSYPYPWIISINRINNRVVHFSILGFFCKYHECTLLSCSSYSSWKKLHEHMERLWASISCMSIYIPPSWLKIYFKSFQCF